MLFSASILVAFLVIYALLHSLLASLSLKNKLRQMFGDDFDRWYRLIYNIVAGITFLPYFAIMALLPDRVLYIVPAPWRWLMLFGQMVGVGGAGLAILQTGGARFLGLTQLMGRPLPEKGALVVQGLYCWVRHPIYFFSLLFLWLTPLMTVNLLISYTIFTLYFYLGSIHEERRLLAEFGPAYADYQQQVPRLIPVPGRCYSPPRQST